MAWIYWHTVIWTILRTRFTVHWDLKFWTVADELNVSVKESGYLMLWIFDVQIIDAPLKPTYINLGRKLCNFYLSRNTIFINQIQYSMFLGWTHLFFKHQMFCTFYKKASCNWCWCICVSFKPLKMLHHRMVKTLVTEKSKMCVKHKNNIVCKTI